MRKDTNVKNVIFVSFVILLFTGCNQADFLGKSRGSKNGKAPPATASQEINSNNSGSPNLATFNSSDFEEQKNMPLQSLHYVVHNIANNDAFEIDGHSFANLQDVLNKLAPQFETIADQYRTIGEYLASVEIHSANDIFEINVDSALAYLSSRISATNRTASPPDLNSGTASFVFSLKNDSSLPSLRERLVMGVYGLALLQQETLGLHLVEDDGHSSTARGLVQASQESDKLTPVQIPDEELPPPMCSQVIFIGTSPTDERCVDALDQITPCPCV